MKIIFVVPDMAGGGTERVISLLANEYIGRGIEVAVLLFAGNRVAYELAPQVEVVSIAPASKGNIGVIIRRLIDMRKYYRNNSGCHIFAFSTMGAFFSVVTTLGIPHHLLVAERIDPHKSPHKLLFRWAYGFAERVVYQTPDAAAFFSKKINKKACVIPNPVDDHIPDRYTGERKKVIVAVGRLEAQKNHRLLLEAFALISRHHPDYQLHIYGVGYLEDDLRQYTLEAGIADAVVFQGFSADVKNAVVDAAMYVSSSDYEGISNSMLEALAMGLPVISTDCPIGGAKMMIEHEVNGLLVPVGDKAKLAEAMERLINDARLMEKISVNSVAVKQKYSLKEIADQYLELVTL